jgi:hypothetical protein
MIQRLGLSLDLSDSEDTEADFLDVIWSKSKRFSCAPCYSHAVTSINGFYSPPLLFERKWFETLCNVNIVYGNLKSKNSQDYGQKPEFGFWK